MFNLSEIFKFIYSLLIAIKRDIIGIYIYLKITRKLDQNTKQNRLTFEVFRENVRKYPNKACFIYNGKTWTFRDMESYSNKIANFFMNKLQLRKGDCVALFMENQPENPGIWLGLSKIGVITAQINTNLRSDPLLHSINVAKAKYVVYGSNLYEAIKTVENQLSKEIGLIVNIENNEQACKFENSLDLNSVLKTLTDEPIQTSEKISCDETLMYVYTSGTTGLPKPAVIKHDRYIGAGFVMFDSARLTSNDRLYVALPIYHGNGCFVGVGAALICGATVVLKRKFSASQFWKDCIEHECTSFVYVGEICRFLVMQPPSAFDRLHKIRRAVGNGLRANYWEEFRDRFNVECIEFYGATEGNCTMINLLSKPGCCGFVPLINSIFRISSVTIIKIDDEMTPIRDKNGFCIECKPGEKGLCVGIIGKRANQAYSGYANNSKATQSKVIENLFRKGQRAFNSGDLMVKDSFGYIKFCDRLGDTFRWRGENVATIEVENVISKHLNFAETIVYAVEIPGEEGRAGMASITSNKSVDIQKLSEYLATNLPMYARPLFIRFLKEVEYTGTFKTKKNNLIEQAYELSKVNGDTIYYLDQKEKQYKLLNQSVYELIMNKKLRF